MYNYTYRAAVSEDQSALKDLCLISYGRYKELLGENWKGMEANILNDTMYEKLLQSSSGFVCEKGNELAGMVFLIPSGNPTELFAADCCYIRLLGVDPAHKGNGIGRNLMQMCIDAARKAGEKTMLLHTAEFQNTARNMYEQMGFELQREVGPFYGKTYFLYRLLLA